MSIYENFLSKSPNSKSFKDHVPYYKDLNSKSVQIQKYLKELGRNDDNSNNQKTKIEYNESFVVFNEHSTSIKSFYYKEDQNNNFHMEDCSNLLDGYSNNPNKGLFILCDGHGGDKAAFLAKEKISWYFKRCFTHKSNFQTAISETFKKVNDEIKQNNWSESQGSTATVVYLVKEIKKPKSEIPETKENKTNEEDHITSNGKSNDEDNDPKSAVKRKYTGDQKGSADINADLGKITLMTNETNNNINNNNNNNNMNTGINKSLPNIERKTIKAISTDTVPNTNKIIKVQEGITEETCYHIFAANIGDTKSILIIFKNVNQLLANKKLTQKTNTHDIKEISKNSYFNNGFNSKDFHDFSSDDEFDYSNENSSDDLNFESNKNPLKFFTSPKLVSNNYTYSPFSEELYETKLTKEIHNGNTREPLQSHFRNISLYRTHNCISNVTNNINDIEKNIQITLLTEEHRLTNPNEKCRIKKFGGHIKGNRINGALQLTRAFGDVNFEKHGVITEPYTRYEKIVKNKDSKAMIVMASDGIWDVIKEEEVSQMILNKIFNNNKIANSLIRLAKKRGSKDNISCTLLELF